MPVFTILHGWRSLLMIVAIVGWSTLMLVLVYPDHEALASGRPSPA